MSWSSDVSLRSSASTLELAKLSSLTSSQLSQSPPTPSPSSSSSCREQRPFSRQKPEPHCALLVQVRYPLARLQLSHSSQTLSSSESERDEYLWGQPSQASPTPSESRSSCCGFSSSGQLSHSSPRPSSSESSCVGFVQSEMRSAHCGRRGSVGAQLSVGSLT